MEDKFGISAAAPVAVAAVAGGAVAAEAAEEQTEF
jgi:large subunit ribosomal protein L7/L12